MLRRDDDSVWLSSRAASLPKSLTAVEPHERGVLLPRRGPPSPRTALSPQSSARSLRSLVLVPRLAEGLGDLLRETAGGPGTRRTVARHPVLRRELGRRGEVGRRPRTPLTVQQILVPGRKGAAAQTWSGLAARPFHHPMFCSAIRCQ